MATQKTTPKATQKVGNDEVRSIITACITLVVGVLFTCSLSFGIRGLSWLIGLSLCVTGAVYILSTLTRKKALLTGEGMLGAGVLTFGVMFIMRQMANIIVDFIPFLMIFVGFAMFVDAFLSKFLRKDANMAKFICSLVVGAATTALGFCLKFINGWADKAAMVFGTILIVYAVYVLLSTLVLKRNAEK